MALLLGSRGLSRFPFVTLLGTISRKDPVASPQPDRTAAPVRRRRMASLSEWKSIWPSSDLAPHFALQNIRKIS